MLLSLVILYVVTLVYLATIERFRIYATLMAIQGWLLMGIALLQLQSGHWGDFIFIIVETAVFKGIVLPWLLLRIIKRAGINKIHSESVTTSSQLFISILALACSALVTYYVADKTINMIFFGVALYALLSGMVLIITHKRIFSHLVGFLIIENGVLLFTLAMGVEMPFLINVGVMLDILVSVLMLGMFIGKLGSRMNDLSSDALTSIKD